MKKELDMVAEFHEKFGYTKHNSPILLTKNEVKIRHHLMQEEVEEYLAGAKAGDLHNLAKELCDILYTTYGTIVAHGLQEQLPEVFAEVHRSNMSKAPGEIKATKGDDYFEPEVRKYF